MSVAFYVVLDKEDPGFDTFVNGKALAKEAQKLEVISKKLGIPTFEDFITMSADDIEDMLGEEVDIPGQEEKWFTPEEGLGFIQKLADHIRVNPSSVTNSKAVLEDLGEYEEVFTKAKGVGARWHLNLDI
ncbi:hypothetical protein [Polaromonas sp. A23]|uniref:hypothetical protein n=1 Tax=Polaromonas sp. A23 TaxID=1944133 RepID=UPI000986B23D|nr:hypothetical protein [Polaromonas sp. A23]OOG47534.1 hypothetical protein B0B52_00840 [Polaromonas sp. A23]